MNGWMYEWIMYIVPQHVADAGLFPPPPPLDLDLPRRESVEAMSKTQPNMTRNNAVKIYPKNCSLGILCLHRQRQNLNFWNTSFVKLKIFYIR